MKKKVHCYFSGMVQGVGFRFAARSLAYRHKLKGGVKNLVDGRVEAKVEGEAKKVDDFLRDLKKEFKNYITDCEIKELPFSGEYENFQIRF